MQRWMSAAVAAMAMSAAAAQAQDTGLHPFAGFGLTGGGDTLVTVHYTNGDTQNIKSGGLVELIGGLEFHPAGAPFSLRGSLAYHFDNADTRNGSVTFSRWPAELMGIWYATDQLHFGVGARKAVAAQLRSSGAASSVGDIDFGSKAGVVVEGEYLVWRGLGVALRYVAEKYTQPGGGADVDGNHVGVRVSWHF